jgi:hypothetical protein
MSIEAANPIESVYWPCRDAEAAASVANSASCHDFIEDVGVLAIVKILVANCTSPW